MIPTNIRHSLTPIPLYRWSDQDDPVAPAVHPTTAPHDCMMPGCPGPVNKRKLETFDELLSILQRAAPYIKTVSRNDTGGYSDNNPTLYEDILAAIANAIPQAR